MAILKVPETSAFKTSLKVNIIFMKLLAVSVITEEGEEIGVVKEILTPGANDVWVVKGKNGKEQLNSLY